MGLSEKTRRQSERKGRRSSGGETPYPSLDRDERVSQVGFDRFRRESVARFLGLCTDIEQGTDLGDPKFRQRLNEAMYDALYIDHWYRSRGAYARESINDELFYDNFLDDVEEAMKSRREVESGSTQDYVRGLA